MNRTQGDNVMLTETAQIQMKMLKSVTERNSETKDTDNKTKQ